MCPSLPWLVSEGLNMLWDASTVKLHVPLLQLNSAGWVRPWGARLGNLCIRFLCWPPQGCTEPVDSSR